MKSLNEIIDEEYDKLYGELILLEQQFNDLSG